MDVSVGQTSLPEFNRVTSFNPLLTMHRGASQKVYDATQGEQAQLSSAELAKSISGVTGPDQKSSASHQVSFGNQNDI